MENLAEKEAGNLSFEEVVRVFEDEHDFKHGTNEWARWALEEANKKAHGKWSVHTIEAESLLKVVLPHHDDGEIELVPLTGMTVEEAIRKIQSIADYDKKCPECWAKIEYVRSKPFSPIFLAREPIWEGDYESFKNESTLFHLDGLHRMIAWGMDGKLKKDQEITAYIAG